MRLYDVWTDSYATERAQIIDALVRRVAGLMTLSERRKASDVPLNAEGCRAVNVFLRYVLNDRLAPYAIAQMVGVLWRDQVTA